MATPETLSPDASSRRRRLTRAALLATPVLVLYGGQFLIEPAGTAFSGFIHSDMALYMAYARQYLEVPGSLFYSNPYDWDPSSPRIYFQPLFWFLGQLLRVGLDPGVAFVGVGLAATMAALVILQRLLEAYHRLSGSMSDWILVLAAWGGGALMLAHLLTGRSLDPEEGFWLLNLGRNFIFPTEAFYHLLTLFVYLFVLRRRMWPAWLVGLLLVVSHPFTGVQYATILFAWVVAERLVAPRTIKWGTVAAFTLPVAIAVGYYLVYLPTFSSHRALMDQYSLDWSLSWATSLAAYGPVAALAGHRIWRRRHPIGPFERFLGLAAGVSFVLAHHDLLIRPMQPLHFTRGHIWFPLFLLGLPSLIDWVRHTGRRRGTAVRRRLIALITFLALFDNATFLAYRATTPTGLFVSEQDRQLIGHVRERGDDPVVLTYGLMSSYLLPTFTSARPYVSYWGNTPEYAARVERARRLFDQGTLPPELHGECVVVAVPDSGRLPAVNPDRWRVEDLGAWRVFEQGCAPPR